MRHRPHDSLFQETDISVNDPNAFRDTTSDLMMGRNQRNSLYSAQTGGPDGKSIFFRTLWTPKLCTYVELYGNGSGFHSMARKTTHQEIN